MNFVLRGFPSPDALRPQVLNLDFFALLVSFRMTFSSAPIGGDQRRWYLWVHLMAAHQTKSNQLMLLEARQRPVFSLRQSKLLSRFHHRSPQSPAPSLPPPLAQASAWGFDICTSLIFLFFRGQHDSTDWSLVDPCNSSQSALDSFAGTTPPKKPPREQRYLTGSVQRWTRPQLDGSQVHPSRQKTGMLGSGTCNS